MMIRLFNNVRHLLALTLVWIAAWIACSCIRERIGPEPDGDGGFLTVRLHLPGEPHGYSLTEMDENEVVALDVLVFREGGDGKEYCMSRTTVDASDIVTDDSDASGRTKICKISVPVSGSFRQRLVFIANARSAVEGSSSSVLKETLLNSIVFGVNGSWPARDNSAFTPFPMWGETPLSVLTELDQIDIIYMMRMVARVDVVVDAGVQSDFELHRVYLYNRYEVGSVVPASTVLEGNGATVRVKASTVPFGVLPVTQPREGEFYATDKGQLRSVTQQIYLMENVPTDVPLQATCFVVGGKYQNGEMRYWRVDLPKQGTTDLSSGFRTFLRNHRYEIVLKTVKGEGYATPDDAFYKSWKQVDVELTEWSLRDVIFEDQKHFSLKASPSSHSYLRSGSDGKVGEFSVWTDYWKSTSDQGWTGELHFANGDKGAWLTLSSTDFRGERGETKSYSFRVEENTTGEDRHAYLKITAGNLIKYVDIYQTNQVVVTGSTNSYDWVQSNLSESPLDGPYRLGVSETVMSIDKTAFTSVNFKISTDYKGGYTTRINGGAGADWIKIVSGGQSNVPIIGQELTFTVADNDLVIPRSAVIDVIAGNLVKRVRVVQLEYMRGDIYTSMDWIQSGQSESPLDGPYRLGVGCTRFDFPKNAISAVELRIASQFPSGYKAEVVRGKEWITITDNAQSVNAWPTPVVMTFQIDENYGNDTRLGELCIAAGGLRKYITVRQSIVADVGTDGAMNDWEDVPSDEPLHGQYTLALSKQLYDCSGEELTLRSVITARASAAGVEWGAFSNDRWITVLTPSGSADGTGQTLSFHVEANPSATAREGTITVAVNHRGNRIEKVIRVRQLGGSTPIVWWEVNSLGYTTQQSLRHSFSLSSRMDWALRLKSDPSGVLRTLYTTGGKANEKGESVYFVLRDFSSVSSPAGANPYRVTLEVYSPKNEFLPKTIELLAVLPVTQ